MEENIEGGTSLTCCIAAPPAAEDLDMAQGIWRGAIGNIQKVIEEDLNREPGSLNSLLSMLTTFIPK